MVELEKKSEERTKPQEEVCSAITAVKELEVVVKRAKENKDIRVNIESLEAIKEQKKCHLISKYEEY